MFFWYFGLKGVFLIDDGDKGEFLLFSLLLLFFWFENLGMFIFCVVGVFVVMDGIVDNEIEWLILIVFVIVLLFLIDVYFDGDCLLLKEGMNGMLFSWILRVGWYEVVFNLLIL